MTNKDLIVNSDLDLGSKVISLLICTAQDLTAEMTRNIKHLNLSLLQVQILHILDSAEAGTLTVNQITDFMMFDNPNVSRALNKLMKQGLILKERSHVDQRVVYITITEQGQQMHIDADKELGKISLDLSMADKQRLYELLLAI
ncbi:MAG: MarR family transcriptional regulator [Anaerolineae bacterium]|nr:MarR family transcriptional regulator [Anaerolineae bacterium]